MSYTLARQIQWDNHIVFMSFHVVSSHLHIRKIIQLFFNFKNKVIAVKKKEKKRKKEKHKILTRKFFLK
jgi:hypothetical protein